MPEMTTMMTEIILVIQITLAMTTIIALSTLVDSNNNNTSNVTSYI